MKSKKEILKQLEIAIDTEDMKKIESGLEALAAVQPEILAEDPKLFGTRIKRMDKENKKMKPLGKTMKIAVAAAAVLFTSIAVYAAVSLNLFSFESGGRFITFRTNENYSEQEAKDFTEKSSQNFEENSVTLPLESFDDVKTAEAVMGMRLVIPSAMPEMKLAGADGQTLEYGDGYSSKTVWLNYSDDAGRMLGITVRLEVVPAGEPITSYTEQEIDSGSHGTYKSRSGAEYVTLTESDPTGEKTAHIATTWVGDYEYTLVFFGFDETERNAITDSADISVLK